MNKLIIGSGGCGLLQIYNLLKRNNINVMYKGGKVKYQNSFEVFKENDSLIWEKDNKSFQRALNYLNSFEDNVIDISHYALPYIDEFILIDPNIKIVIIQGDEYSTIKSLFEHWGYRNPLIQKRGEGRPRYALKQFPNYSNLDFVGSIQKYVELFYNLAYEATKKYPNNVKILEYKNLNIKFLFHFLNIRLMNDNIFNFLNSEEEIYTTTLHGGLGNNLFQIAETYAFCKENNLSIPKFGTWIMEDFPLAYNADNFLGRHKGTQEEFKLTFPNIEWLNNPKANANTKFMINDMFDFSKVNHMRKEIISYLSPSKQVLQYIENKYNHLYNKPTISLHLRYCTLPADDHVNGYVPDDYYIKTLNFFKEEKNVLVFSDNNQRAQQQIHYFDSIAPQHNYYLIDENQFISLFMMNKCDNHILHVSTFSFWSSYLDSKLKSITFYPKEFEICHTPYMIPKDLNWIKV